MARLPARYRTASSLVPLLVQAVVVAEFIHPAYSQLSSYSTSETRLESAPLQVQATFDNISKISITSSGVVGLKSPWSGSPVDFSRQGGASPNFYDPSGAILFNLTTASGPCLNSAAFSADCAEQMPTLRYEAGKATLADYYAIKDPNTSFNLYISTISPDQPSSLSVIRPSEGGVLIPNTQAGASRYQITVPGGTGMVISTDEQGGILLDASKATAGARGYVTMMSVTAAADQTATSRSFAEISLDSPTAMVASNRVNLVNVAGANVNSIGRGCMIDSQGNPSGSSCTVGILVTTERFQVWDPVQRQPVQLTRPRLIDTDYVKANPNLLHSTVNLTSLQADTNQRFATTCDASGRHCRYVTEENEDISGLRHQAIIPINELPISNAAFTTILLPSYSTQIFNAGGVPSDGLGAIMRSADGSGNSINNVGIGVTTSLETSNTIIMRN